MTPGHTDTDSRWPARGQAIQRSGFWGVLPDGPPGPDGQCDWAAALWAPDAALVTLVLDGKTMPMSRDDDGSHRLAFRAAPDTPYGFDLGHGLRPDPAARAQMGGVHGPSRLVGPAGSWPETEVRWRGRPWAEAALLELHIGLFTPEGTFEAAARRLPELAAMGVTGVEVMPVAQFPGQRGWGYDGVLPFAVHPSYGGAAGLRFFVATAHALGIAVILDVVYNHFGPEGCYLHEIAPAFFRPEGQSPWGAEIDFAQPAVQEFFLSNVAMWIGDFHLDGLRIDAAHHLDPALLDEIARTARASAPKRRIWLILEDERNLARPVDPAQGLYDGQWNDDYHHALHVLLTGEDEGYYRPFAEDPMADLLLALSEGQVSQGQARPHAEPRGEVSAHLPVTAFVNANQTHDQVGNRAQGERLVALIGDAPAQVVHALLLLSPYVPLLFMGEEEGEAAPFLYFIDLEPRLTRKVEAGRQREFAAFGGFQGQLMPAGDPATFEHARPYRGDPERRAAWRALSAQLLALRQNSVVPLIRAPRIGAPHIRRTGARSFQARWRFVGGEIGIAANLGAPPAAPLPSGPVDFHLGDLDRDPWAIAFRAQSGGGRRP